MVHRFRWVSHTLLVLISIAMAGTASAVPVYVGALVLRRRVPATRRLLTAAALVVLLGVGNFCSAVTIETVPVGNPGNPADSRPYFPFHYGSVDYAYRIGKTEITNVQYTAFLNAVAASDPNNLYHANMGIEPQGGIVRNGDFGNFSYSVKTAALNCTYDYTNKPVVFVSWFSAVRFANWLHNGQPSGPQDASTTEDGAYAFTGPTLVGQRKANARWWIPNHDEWYKAAYYDPSTESYFEYPTGTNSLPNNNLPTADTGNSANFYDADYTTGVFEYPLTDAGAYTLSASRFGTLDQGCSVFELIGSDLIAGGSWNRGFGRSFMAARNAFANFAGPILGTNGIGFRVAGIPEPSTLVLAAFAGLFLMGRGRRLPFAALLTFVVVACPYTAHAITIETVPVGNPGNAGDTRYIDTEHPNGVGSVAYNYRIGKTEVTHAQYVEFLNAVAAADPYELSHTDMSASSYGGIVRSCSSGSYTYAVKAAALAGAYPYDHKPVLFVDSGDAMRFANWLHNDQPSGAEDAKTTENGAYTLNGATSNAARCTASAPKSLVATPQAPSPLQQCGGVPLTPTFITPGIEI